MSRSFVWDSVIDLMQNCAYYCVHVQGHSTIEENRVSELHHVGQNYRMKRRITQWDGDSTIWNIREFGYWIT